jgi:hypothetical protein
MVHIREVANATLRTGVSHARLENFASETPEEDGSYKL